MDERVFADISLNEEVQVECAEFAGLSNNNYGKRGQKDERRKKEQCFFGKLGEWVAHAALRPFFIDLSYPNMEVYEGRRKTWDNDLRAGEVSFACKSCEWNSDSWIFQKADEDGHGTDTEIYDPSAKDKLLVFVQLAFGNTSGRIRAIAPLSQIRKLDLFDEPRSNGLKGFKDAVYMFNLKYYGFVDKLHPSVEDFLHRVQV